MDTTWRKLYRKTLDNAVVRRFGAPALGVLAWMIAQADDEGSLRLSVRETARQLKVSYKTIRNIIDAFRDDGTISMECGAHGSTATLENWSRYQSQGAQRAHNGRTTGAHNSNETKDLNANPAHNGRTRGAQEAHPTQEPAFPPHTPLYRIEKDSPSPLPPCGGSGGRGPGAGMGKMDDFPKTPDEVVQAARECGFVMPTDTASQWLQMKRRSDWRDSEGVRIRDWRRMLSGWCSSEGVRTVAAEKEDEERRKREYDEIHRKSMEMIERYEKEKRR